MSEEKKTMSVDALEEKMHEISKEAAEDKVNEEMQNFRSQIASSQKAESPTQTSPAVQRQFGITGDGDMFKRALPFMAESFKRSGDCTAQVPDLAREGVELKSGRFRKSYSDGSLHQKIERDLGSVNVSSGGALVETEVMADLMPALSADSVLFQADPEVIDVGSGSLRLAIEDSVTSPSAQDEGSTVVQSEPSYENKKAETNKIGVRAVVNRELLERNFVGAEDFIIRRLRQDLQNKLDKLWFRGSGANFQPAGLDKQALSGNVFSTAGNSFDNLVDDHKKRRNKLDEANVRSDRRALFMSAPARNLHEFTRDSDGDLQFRGQINAGEFFGDDLFVTNNIDTSGSNSDIYYVEMSDVIVARDASSMRIEMSEHEKFSDDQIVIRAVVYFDFILAHEEAASITEDVSH